MALATAEELAGADEPALLDYPLPPLAGGNVNLMQMRPQLAGREQIRIQKPLVLFQIVYIFCVSDKSE